MDMTLGTWRVSIQRIPPTSAELAALYDNAAHYWQNALRRLGFLRAYALKIGRSRRAYKHQHAGHGSGQQEHQSNQQNLKTLHHAAHG
jgi:hypothetical protein